MSVATSRALLAFLVRDLRGSASLRSLWVFCACLYLGIALIAASGGLLELVRGGIAAQERFLFGGDAELSSREPLSPAALAWLGERAEVSRLAELRTMLGTPSGDFTVVELQSVDAAYPLYGEVRLEPALSLAEAVAPSPEGVRGAAFDPALAERYGLGVGDRVDVGTLELELRALIVEQPDRSLRADVRGPPLIVAEETLAASGLAGPMSLIEYEYRLRADEPAALRDALHAAFPDAGWEMRTVEERGEFVTERLEQIASVLMLVAFATLAIGGLGVANSVASYLGEKRRTVATLAALGARDAQIAFVLVGQIVLLAALASVAAAASGALVAHLVARALATRLPVPEPFAALAAPTVAAVAFGVLAALLFALPILGRALARRPAALIRGDAGVSADGVPRGWLLASAATLAALVALLLVVIPEPLVALGFVLAIALSMLALEALVRGVRALARRLSRSAALDGRFALRLALGGLYRPGSALRPMLLSLGTALTLLVGSALVIVSMLHAVDETVPERAPTLVFYDIADDQLGEFRALVESLEGFVSLQTTPLVLGRLVEVNGVPLSTDEDAQRALEANDEHKLGYRVGGIDAISLVRGAWWPEDHAGPARFAMEDREAEQLGLEIGDALGFSILGESLEAELAAIYEQGTLETSFWFEGLFSDGALAPFVTRHVGSAFLAPGTGQRAIARIGERFPNVVSISTVEVLGAARSILRAASLGVALVALVSLVASVLVMASVVAVNRRRQIHEASVLHAVGTRMGTVVRAVALEHALLAVLLSLFAALVGGVLGTLVLRYRIELPAVGLATTGPLVALTVAAACLFGGWLWTVRSLDARPATLLRRAA